MHDAFASLSVVLALFAGLAPGDLVKPDETHCVVFVVDQKQNGELVTTDPACFPVKAEAEVWAEIGLTQTSPPLPTFNGESTVVLSTFTLGTHYDGANGTGSSVSVVGTSCTGGHWNTPSTWDNRISSSYNGCARLRHWDLPDKSGASQNTYGAGTTDNLTSMNNKTESVSYHSS
jgi:hypothetical protein